MSERRQIEEQRKDLEAVALAVPPWASSPFMPQHRDEYVPVILPVDSILFTQTTVAKMTKNKQSTLAQLVAELLLGKIALHSLELDDVTEADSRWWSCNNRRLCVLKTCQAVSRALQVQLYGIAPLPLSLYPYVQIRCLVQQRRTTFKINDIPDAITPRCVGRNFTKQQWLEGASYGHTSTRIRVAEAIGKVAPRGSKRETELFCPEGFAAAMIKYFVQGEESDGEFIRWAAAGETATSAGANVLHLNTKAAEALQALRATVQAALKNAKTLAFPPDFEELSQENRPFMERKASAQRASSRSRSPPMLRRS